MNEGVVYTTKELLERIDSKLDRLDVKLDTKADRDRVHDLSSRVSAIELLAATRQELPLEVRQNSDRISRLESWRNRLAGGFTVILVIASFEGYKIFGG